ncbi:HelD family protein [Rathayibacter sp. CAU 1779]
MHESELDRERDVVAELYGRLDSLREDTVQRLAAVRRQTAGGTHQARGERDAYARLYEDRILQLREVEPRLVFGRLQLETDDRRAASTLGHAQGGPSSTGGGAAGGEDPLRDPLLRYVGRIGLRDDDEHTVLLDWRAPQASAFYQATAANPLGVAARRRLTMRDRNVLRVDDEVFDASLFAEAGTRPDEVSGDAALMAALMAQRTGRMNDIVATIQSEQDRIIRSELRDALVVQGGPGTGKTAVALHRAAYLLYAHRQKLQASGVLVVGPTRAFLTYIEEVLPALGETGVVMQSLGELFPGVSADTDDTPAVAQLKGSKQMVNLLHRAVEARQKVPAEASVIEVDNERIVVEPALIADAVRRAQRTGKPHNVARITFVKNALTALTAQLAEQLRGRGQTLDEEDLAVLREDVRTSYDARVLLNTAWLPLTPQKLLGDLYARPQWLAELTPTWSEEKRALLHRSRDAALTVSDIPLLDEAAEVLGEAPDVRDQATRQAAKEQRKRDLRVAKAAIADAGAESFVTAEQLVEQAEAHGDGLTTAERAASDRTWVYGHVVVDEAQELSPMQWRLLVRRCPMKSFTIVGDIAQSSSAHGGRSWADAVGPLFRNHWRLEELTVNYRTPAQIARPAEEFARASGLPITPARAVREGDWPVREVASGTSDLASAVVEAAAYDRGVDDSGALAVIAPTALMDSVADAVASRFGADAGRGASGLVKPIVVLTAHDAKGLEFDAVVIADPDAVVAESPRGASALYVAMTRPTQRLTLVRPASR